MTAHYRLFHCPCCGRRLWYPTEVLARLCFDCLAAFAMAADELNGKGNHNGEEDRTGRMLSVPTTAAVD